MAEAYFDRIRHWESCCAEVIARGVEEGAFREIDPGETALKLGSYANGLGNQRDQGDRSLTAEKARQWLHEFARALLNDGAGLPIPRSSLIRSISYTHLHYLVRMR